MTIKKMILYFFIFIHCSLIAQNEQLIKHDSIENNNIEKHVRMSRSALPKPYPLVNANITKYNGLKKDTNGIPILNNNYTANKDVYYPISIVQIAAHYYKHYYITGDVQSKKYFLKLTNWLKDNFTDNGNWGGWYANTRLEGTSYNLPKKWLSAMSQGIGISVMFEAYSITGDKQYLEIISKVLNSFEVDIVNGGISTRWGQSRVYLEYPTVPIKVVLNGFIFSLAGLHDYYSNTKNLKAKKLFDQGIKTLHEHLPQYDAGFNTYYTQSNSYQRQHTIASATGAKYHDLHIAQMLWLYKVTKDIFFYDWAYLFLQQDFNDAVNLGLNNKFKSIRATRSIEPKEYGTNNLNDRIWTYGNYWSTNKYPTELEVEFSRKVDKFSEFILVTTKSEVKPSNFKFFVLINNKWQESKFNLVDNYLNTIPGYTAFVQRYVLSKEFDKVQKVKFIFYDHQTESKVLAIREIIFFYDVTPELKFLVKKLNY